MANLHDISTIMDEVDIDAEENDELCFYDEIEQESNKFELC